eukprot:CAMPEP_0116848258 /NCGR_PEP_ID=MMETSP0418-20121206/14893_1 /TAXON_ID=1158023 /ORGANISM="Astrosyne radiata, Strain 13vi08-1A" /LENGTH=64 /DNA_ID=CAMNT_0004479801 /DNA_START=97 /DNA_END=291 /DNA_ORIENTATION=+
MDKKDDKDSHPRRLSDLAAPLTAPISKLLGGSGKKEQVGGQAQKWEENQQMNLQMGSSTRFVSK